MSLNTGQVVGSRYRIVKLLGQGGFGAVYRAWDVNLTKPVALKLNLDLSPQAQQQFEREAKILSNLSHPNLPRVTDHFSEPPRGQFLVMDFIEGEDLEAVIKRAGKIVPAVALDWIGQVADALNYLHNQTPPIIHRDIKPANIRITTEGKAYLVDFGLVKLYTAGKKTTMGARAVTPGYAPPEQYGSGNTDARTDIYALAATLYTALTGVEPVESMERIHNDPLRPTTQINPQVSETVGAAVAKGMSPNPALRFGSAYEFVAALQSADHLPQTVLISSTHSQPIPTRAGIHPIFWVLGTAAVVALLFLFIVLPNLQQQSADEPQAPITFATADDSEEPPTATLNPPTTVVEVEKVAAVQSDENQVLVETPSLTPTPTQTPLPTDTPTPTNTPTLTPLPTVACGIEGFGRNQILYASDKSGRWLIYALEASSRFELPFAEMPGTNSAPVWSPDGTQIAFHAERNGNWDIYAMNADGSQERRLTTDPESDQFPMWSPDGTQLVFNSTRNRNYDLYIVNVNNGSLRQLTSDTAQEAAPSWSPDGTQIVFEADYQGNSDIYILNLSDLSSRRIVANTAHDVEAAWSPDGTRIAYATRADGDYEINVINVDGSNNQQLTSNSHGDTFPAWSSDGTQIVYESWGTDGIDIYTMNADGSLQTELVNTTAQSRFPSWFLKDGECGDN